MKKSRVTILFCGDGRGSIRFGRQAGSVGSAVRDKYLPGVFGTETSRERSDCKNHIKLS